MSTVKISELPVIPHLNHDTTQTLITGVDLVAGVTGKMTTKVLAQSLYSNDVLNVGNNQTFLPNTVAQFSLAGGSYIQTNLVNLDDGGTADMVITANTGTDSTYFMDVGYANKDYQPGQEYNNIGTSVSPLDGYVYVQGLEGNDLGGNLVIGAVTTNKEVRFIAGGGTSENVVAKMNTTSIMINRPLVFQDGSTQVTSSAPWGTSNIGFSLSNSAYIQANNAGSFSNGAFSKANNAGSFANGAFSAANTHGESISTINLTLLNTQNYANGSFTKANNAGSFANGAFTKANNALANTTGTLDGSLTITGETNIGSRLIVANTFNSTTQATVEINTSGITNLNSLQQPVALRLTGSSNNSVKLALEDYGTGLANNYNLILARAARGTVNSPTATQNNDVMMRIAVNGYATTGFPTTGVARIDFVATENYTDTSRGSQIQFWNTTNGGNTLIKIATMNADSVQFLGTVNPQKGFAYTPNVYTTPSTSYTIDFQQDSMIKMSVNADSTITFSNYQTGKIVEVWITNSAIQNKVITHGCLANNSTSKSTTFTIQASSCAFLKYFSIDGDHANTFVSITA